MDTKELDIPQELQLAIEMYRQFALIHDDSTRALESARTEHSKSLMKLAELQGRIDGFIDRLKARAPEGTPWCGPQGPYSNGEMVRMLRRIGPGPAQWRCDCGNLNPPEGTGCICGRSRP